MSLSTEQQELLQIFQEMTQIRDNALCVDILAANNWNVDEAVNNFVGGDQQNQRAQPQNHGQSSVRNRQQLDSISRSQNQQQPARLNIMNMIFAPLRWLFQTRPLSINPDLDARKFLAAFDLKYGDQHPSFEASSYQRAVAQAFRRSTFLVIYIHSPMHEDTNNFCNQVLSTQTVQRFIDQNAVSWAGRVWDPEAYSLSIQLNAFAFPFLALLVCQSERVVQIVDRVQGYTDESSLIARLRNAITVHRGLLTQLRNDAGRREEVNQLRAQQDREYREAAEHDARERARRLQEEEERAQAEIEKQQADELQAAVDLSNHLAFEVEISRKKLRLRMEPPATAADSATIRFQLPQPQSLKINRRFYRDDLVQSIFDFLAAHFYDSGSNVKNFGVSTHFPKVELEDMTKTIEEVGLFPRAMLYVHDRDA